MADLTDARIDELVRWTVDSRNVDMCAIHTALKELVTLRAARAADEERVREMVRQAAMDVLPYCDLEGDLRPIADDIAARAAKQLATARVRLSDEERGALEWLLGRATDRAILGDVGGHGVQDFALLVDARAVLVRLTETP